MSHKYTCRECRQEKVCRDPQCKGDCEPVCYECIGVENGARNFELEQEEKEPANYDPTPTTLDEVCERSYAQKEGRA